MALAGGVLWVACLVGCLREQSLRNQVGSIPHAARLPVIFLFLFLSLGLISGIQHGVPLTVMELGLISYLFPVIGLVIGNRFGSDAKAVREMMAAFCILNAILIGTALLEVAGVRSPVLGGILMEWYRVRGAGRIPLPSGVYRSPDILGLHAAHVFAFGLLLTKTASSVRARRIWFGVVYWGGIILIISARRKMQGLAAVFLISFVCLMSIQHFRSGWSGFRGLPFRRAMGGVLLTVLGFTALLVFAPAHVVYAESILTEGPARIATTLFSAPLVTLRQSGYQGAGLGAATQGNTAVELGFVSGWQEDGLSRLVLEGGIVGAIFAVCGGVVLLKRLICRIVTDEAEKRGTCTIRRVLDAGLLSLIVGNLACFSISHLHMSGDLVFGALTGFWVGCLYSAKPGIEEGGI